MANGVGRQRLKERLREVRAELILNVAEEVFEERGYHETTMDEIAARCGMAKGTLYQHFPGGKDELITALFARHLEHFAHAVAQAPSAASTARGRLRYILEYVYLERSGLHARLLQLLTYGGDLRQTLKERLHPRLAQISAAIRALLEQGQHSGEFRATLSTDLLLQTFMHLLLFNKYQPVLEREHLSPENLVEQVAQIFFDGIASDTSGEERI
ncbi:TetR/AcrR family transcriptional regulator [Thermogemmatispora sp.]|uniref:TetR/AcrR family transcriptional regulator n=1 Tax=Thermogemmatispora sp. TaxID=1968838 RepID=UPI001DFE41F0|nr:TetR/AcrR family transcriptional regulator [Thermogemmatispora sp.]MBX5450219.1 TetR/AcrR family transcriptional regulator [Thermogemmatispora sp.]